MRKATLFLPFTSTPQWDLRTVPVSFLRTTEGQCDNTHVGMCFDPEVCYFTRTFGKVLTIHYLH
jgi:hypothetical protein